MLIRSIRGAIRGGPIYPFIRSLPWYYSFRGGTLLSIHPFQSVEVPYYPFIRTPKEII